MHTFLNSVREHASTGPLAKHAHANGDRAALEWLSVLPDLAVHMCERWSFTPTAAHAVIHTSVSTVAHPCARHLLLCTGRLVTGHKAVLVLAPDATSVVGLNPRLVLLAHADLNAHLLDWTPEVALLLDPSSTAVRRR